MEIKTSFKNPLSMPLSALRGVGPKTLGALNKAEIYTIFDLLLRIPKSFVEQEVNPGIKYMQDGHTYVCEVDVLRLKTNGFSAKRRLEAIVQDETGLLSAVFFGPAVNYAEDLFKKHKTLTLIGEAKRLFGRIQMVHPKVITAKDVNASLKNRASYSQIAGFSSTAFKKLVDLALTFIATSKNKDHLSKESLDELSLDNLYEAFQHIHHPEENSHINWENKGKCKNFRRLAFEELILFYTRIFKERHSDSKNQSKAIKIHEAEALAKEILSFKLTKAQHKAINEIIADLEQETAMSRLLQGDVGAGKTAVSALAALNVIKSGYQVAVMAPTEILAEQLSNVFKQFFTKTPYKTCLITASTKAKERKELIKQITAKEINIVLGTHALLSEDIIFNDLGLLIIDEQHRFGVKQRASIIREAEKRQGFCPHLLVMTATPIPRSLALTFYGDLDLSVIDERPPGRLPVITKLLSGEVLNSLKKLGERVIESKQKAFVVFPLVEESENMDLADATNAANFLKNHFGESSTMLLHGKMKADEKLLALNAFKENRIQFLVSTTVVEVGVDIPDATCMAIIHAERFGIAQLHQLRGRVGRSDKQSYCFLLSDIKNRFSASYERLLAICHTEDGFLLAKKDLELRGPGEILGTKQAGLTNFLVFNHQDFANLIEPAKKYAKKILNTKELWPQFGYLLTKEKAHFS